VKLPALLSSARKINCKMPQNVNATIYSLAYKPYLRSRNAYYVLEFAFLQKKNEKSSFTKHNVMHFSTHGMHIHL
jgi:hypothetical protein